MGWLNSITFAQAATIYMCLMPVFGLAIMCLLEFDEEEPSVTGLAYTYVCIALYPVTLMFFLSVYLYRLYKAL